MKKTLAALLLGVFLAGVSSAASPTDFGLGVGPFGGAIGVKTILSKKVNPLLTLGVDLAYATSQQYSLSGIEFFLRRNLNKNFFLAFTLSQMSYSDAVEFTVLTNSVKKGGQIGGGVSLGLKPYLSSPLTFELGYNTVLGLNLTAQLGFLNF